MTEQLPAVPWDGVHPADLMRVEEIGPDRYANPISRIREDRHLYGGQVMAHALAAAALTAPGREVHSLHGYFLRPGDCFHGVAFDVERTRDGRSFSARRVVARQRDGAILHMECSFREPDQRSIEHQLPMADDIPPPEDLLTLAEYAERNDDERAREACRMIGGNSVIEMKPVDPRWLNEKHAYPRQRLWLRVSGAEDVTDPLVQMQLLTYLSDFWFAGVSLTVHDPEIRRKRTVLASIDHALWFHNPVRFDDWLLYEAESPISARSTSLSRGSIYRRDGTLVASSAQEALIRI